MLYEFKYRVLTKQELADIEANSYLMDQILSRCVTRCANSQCNYPLPATDNYRLFGIGDVCGLCYAMYHAVSSRAWFVEAQREFNLRPPPQPPQHF